MRAREQRIGRHDPDLPLDSGLASRLRIEAALLFPRSWASRASLDELPPLVVTTGLDSLTVFSVSDALAAFVPVVVPPMQASGA